jgi:L-cysteine/cystine lyase
MDFPALQGRTYLNYGGQGVLARSTLDTISQCFHDIEARGCFSIANNRWCAETIRSTKQRMAEELVCAPDHITLTENTTGGCNIALWSWDWQRGDRLLLSDCEHPAIVAIGKELQRRCGVEIDILPLLDLGNSGDPDLVCQRLVAHLHPRTRMVCLSHILWNTGLVLPLSAIAELCHARSILVAVDGAQSVGVLPLNLSQLGVDFYAFTAHKWWCAPLGVGGLYVNPQIWERVHAPYVGWRGLEGHDRGAKFEVATSAYPLYQAVQTALTVHQSWGSAHDRYQRLTKLSAQLWHDLAHIPKVHRFGNQSPPCGLVLFSIEGRSAAEVSLWLENERQIFVRSLPEPKCLRASVHYLTQPHDLATLLEALSEL